MEKNNRRAVLTQDEKLYKAVQALFVLEARKIGMTNKDMRELLGCQRADVDAIAKIVNKTIKTKDNNDE